MTLLRSFDNDSGTGVIDIWSLRDSQTVAPATHNYPKPRGLQQLTTISSLADYSFFTFDHF